MLTIKNTEKNTFAQELQPLSLSIGIIHAIDAVNRVAAVAVGGLTSFVYSVLPGFDANRISVESTEGFSIGDQVLIAHNPHDSVMSSGISDKGIIICKVAVNSTTFTTLTSTVPGLPHDHQAISKQEEVSPAAKLYTGQGVQAGYAVSQFPPRNNINEHVGQAYNLSGENTNLHVDHDTVSLSAGHSTISLTSFGIESERYLLKNTKSLVSNSKDTLIGDTLLHEQIQDSDLKASSRRIVKFGALSDGLSDGIVDSEGNILSRIKRDFNGFTKIDVSHGFVVDRGGPVSLFTITDTSPIQELSEGFKDTISKASGEGTTIEDSIASFEGVEVHGSERRNYVLAPIDEPGDTTADGLDITNTLTGKTTKAARGRSRFGELPDGSFVISDSWGSEIRMFGGDIFITPARRLMITTPDDFIVTAGGGATITGDKVVNIASANGPVELVGKSLNAAGTDDVVLVGNAVSIAGTTAKLRADKDMILTSADKLDVLSGTCVNLVAQRTNIVGTSSTTLSTKQACIKVKSDLLELGGARCTILSDLIVSDDESREFEVGDLLISPNNGTGFIGCTGYCVINKGLSVNSWAKVRENLSTNAVTVVSYNKEAVGVFSGKKPQSESVPAIATINGIDSNSSEDVSKSPTPGSVKIAMDSFFKTPQSTAYTIVPGIVSGNGKQLSAITVEGSSGREYIYPGKDFWEKSGLYVISPETYYNVYDAPDMDMYGMSKFKKSK